MSADGKFLALHSLVVSPRLQHQGVGSWMLESYLRVPEVEALKRVLLITKEPLIPFYEEVGFILRGPSKMVHGREQVLRMFYSAVLLDSAVLISIHRKTDTLNPNPQTEAWSLP